MIMSIREASLEHLHSHLENFKHIIGDLDDDGEIGDYMITNVEWLKLTGGVVRPICELTPFNNEDELNNMILLIPPLNLNKIKNK